MFAFVLQLYIFIHFVLLKIKKSARCVQLYYQCHWTRNKQRWETVWDSVSSIFVRINNYCFACLLNLMTVAHWWRLHHIGHFKQPFWLCDVLLSHMSHLWGTINQKIRDLILWFISVISEKVFSHELFRTTIKDLAHFVQSLLRMTVSNPRQ